MSNGFYNRELSESLPAAIRGISSRFSAVFRTISRGVLKFKFPFLIMVFVSLAIGVIVFISWYRGPSQPVTVQAVQFPEPSDEADSLPQARVEAPVNAPDPIDDETSFPEIVVAGTLRINFAKVRVSRAAKTFARDALPSLLKTCTGLKTYAPDLEFTDVDDVSDAIAEDARGIGISFKVSDRPEIIPNVFKATGHICEYRITPDQKTVIIQKRVCAEICFEREFEHTGRNMYYPL